MADKMAHTEDSIVVCDVIARHTEDNTHPVNAPSVNSFKNRLDKHWSIKISHINGMLKYLGLEAEVLVYLPELQL